MLTRAELLKAKRNEVLAIAAKHGAYNIRVFGSVAKGQSGLRSDIDLLVRLEHGRSLLDHVRLARDLETLLGCKVDVATENSLKPRFKAQVLNEAIPL